MKQKPDFSNTIFTNFHNTLPKDHSTIVKLEGDITFENDGLKYCVVCQEALQTRLTHHNNEYVLPVPCSCIRELEEKQKRYELYLANLERIPIEFRGVSLKDLTVKVDFVKPFINQFQEIFKPRAKGLYIFGDKGCGKTFACKCIINELCKQEVKVFAIRFAKLLDIYSNFKDPQGIKDVENKIKNSHLIYLDDLGATRETDFSIEKINDIVNFMYELKIPIIITSNLSRKELADKLNDDIGRAYDRLFERCHPVKITTPSFRRLKAQEEKEEFDNILGL